MCTTLLMGPSYNGLYSLCLPSFKSIHKLTFIATKASSIVWHHRLGHPYQRVLSLIISSCSLPVSSKQCSIVCSSCQLGKSSKVSLPASSLHNNNIFYFIYYDVWGPSLTISFDGCHVFMLYVDHHSRYMWFYPLKLKSDVYTTFTNFVKIVERQFNSKIKSFKTDWGGEFRNLSPFFTNLDIIHLQSCHHTSERNGFVERRHCYVVETGLTLLAHANLPQRFWQFAFEIVVYLINCLSSRISSNKSPY